MPWVALIACDSSTTTDAEETSGSSSPFANATFYVDPDSNAAEQIEEWQESRPDDAALLEQIASQPNAKWFGDWNDDIADDVDELVATIVDEGHLPVLVAYNIPNRDCGSYSDGGAADDDAYLAWISDFAEAIGDRAAVIILEPDATSLVTCLSDDEAAARFNLLSQTVTLFKAKPNIAVYIDAGNADWISAEVMADRLTQAGIADADGFALNVSNFHTTAASITYAEEISLLVNDKHVVIDTSRNGNGSNGEWCNPSGRLLGENPTTETGHDLVDALLWIKPPGQSDGECNGGPPAGEWWAEYALELAGG